MKDIILSFRQKMVTLHVLIHGNMSSVTIKKVENRKDLENFIQFHYDLYNDCPYEVPSLHSDEVRTLTPAKNAASKFCDSQLFLAYKDGKIAGRVAAIINRRANERWATKSVRFGWLDFIDDIEVSQKLLDAVGEWGKTQGMEDMVGPLGYTDMDPEGMLTAGFNELGTMATLYNYDYYPKHIEQIGGFEKANDYVEYNITIPEKLPERFVKISEMVMKRYNYKIKKLKRSEINKGDYGHKIFEIINTTYKDLFGYSEMTKEQIDQYVKMYLPVIDLHFVTLILDGNANDKIIGVAISLPSLSIALQKCKNGRLFPTGWIHLLKALKLHDTEGIDLLLIGVLPEYKGKGVNALFFYDLFVWYRKYNMKWAETQVEMETNENVQSQWDAFEKRLHKRRRCFKKSLIG